jgi:uncharacterized protein YutE (UPF0331/DUF86 family)
MTNTGLVQSKMSSIENDVQQIKEFSAPDTHSIIEDNRTLRAIERLFQLIVDTAVSINEHIISSEKFPMPDDYRNTFVMLGEKKVLPMEFALKIAGSVGLRNLIVHKYGDVDLGQMIADIKADIEQYEEYLQYIEKYIKMK